MDTVEIFKTDTSQWYTTDPLPIACSNMSAYPTSDNTCYLLGGYKPATCINSVFRASLDDLLQNATVFTVGQGSSCDHHNSTHKSAWESLPDTPNYQPTIAILLNSTVVAIGGWKTTKGREPKGEIHTFSPSTNSWVYTGDLPTPRAVTTAAVLSPTELLVIGGWDGEKRVKTVYKGTLVMSM